MTPLAFPHPPAPTVVMRFAVHNSPECPERHDQQHHCSGRDKAGKHLSLRLQRWVGVGEEAVGCIGHRGGLEGASGG